MLNDTVDKQIRYALEQYRGDITINPKKLIRKLISLYILGNGGYWQGMGDGIVSDDSKFDDECVAMEMDYRDASAVGGIMSCVPAVVITLMKLSNLSVKDLELTEEDISFLNSMDDKRGTDEQFSLLDTTFADESL